MNLVATGLLMKKTKSTFTNRETGEKQDKYRLSLYQKTEDDLLKVGCDEDTFKLYTEGKEITINVRPGSFTTSNGDTINYLTAIKPTTPFDEK